MIGQKLRLEREIAPPVFSSTSTLWLLGNATWYSSSVLCLCFLSKLVAWRETRLASDLPKCEGPTTLPVLHLRRTARVLFAPTVTFGAPFGKSRRQRCIYLNRMNQRFGERKRFQINLVALRHQRTCVPLRFGATMTTTTKRCWPDAARKPCGGS